MSDPKPETFRERLENAKSRAITSSAIFPRIDTRFWIDEAVRLHEADMQAKEEALEQARKRIKALEKQIDDTEKRVRKYQAEDEIEFARVVAAERADRVKAEREAADLRAEVERIRCPRKDREFFGMLVRHVWVEWAKTQPNPKPSWLQPWEELTEPEREVDRLIGERCAEFAVMDLREKLAALEEEERIVAGIAQFNKREAEHYHECAEKAEKALRDIFKLVHAEPAWDSTTYAAVAAIARPFLSSPGETPEQEK